MPAAHQTIYVREPHLYARQHYRTAHTSMPPSIVTAPELSLRARADADSDTHVLPEMQRSYVVSLDVKIGQSQPLNMADYLKALGFDKHSEDVHDVTVKYKDTGVGE